MNDAFDKLFDRLKKNIQNEDAIFKFITSRIISEMKDLLDNYDVDYGIDNLKQLIKELIYDPCKARQNEYIMTIHNSNSDLKIFIDAAEIEGTNSLECSEKAKQYVDRLNTINVSINYDKEFNDVRAAILKIIGFNNQQLEQRLNIILNNDKSSLQTSVMKLHNDNQNIFKEAGEEIQKIGLANNKKKINPTSQLDLIRNFLVDFNDKNKDATKSKIIKIFENYSEQISSILVKKVQTIKEKNGVSLEMFQNFASELDKNYEIFYSKLNGEFVSMLINRTGDIVKENPNFEISRDSVTHQNSQNFAKENKIINLDIAFANIEQLLIKKYSLNASDPKYSEILAMMNTKNAEMNNLIQRIENEMLLQNIIEMQSQINQIYRRTIITTEVNN